MNCPDSVGRTRHTKGDRNDTGYPHDGLADKDSYPLDGLANTSLQCYSVLCTIAQLLRKMKLKNLVS